MDMKSRICEWVGTILGVGSVAWLRLPDRRDGAGVLSVKDGKLRRQVDVLGNEYHVRTMTLEVAAYLDTLDAIFLVTPKLSFPELGEVERVTTKNWKLAAAPNHPDERPLWSLELVVRYRVEV